MEVLLSGQTALSAVSAVVRYITTVIAYIATSSAVLALWRCYNRYHSFISAVVYNVAASLDFAWTSYMSRAKFLREFTEPNLCLLSDYSPRCTSGDRFADTQFFDAISRFQLSNLKDYHNGWDVAIRLVARIIFHFGGVQFPSGTAAVIFRSPLYRLFVVSYDHIVCMLFAYYMAGDILERLLQFLEHTSETTQPLKSEITLFTSSFTKTFPWIAQLARHVHWPRKPRQTRVRYENRPYEFTNLDFSTRSRLISTLAPQLRGQHFLGAQAYAALLRSTTQTVWLDRDVFAASRSKVLSFRTVSAFLRWLLVFNLAEKDVEEAVYKQTVSALSLGQAKDYYAAQAVLWELQNLPYISRKFPSVFSHLVTLGALSDPPIAEVLKSVYTRHRSYFAFMTALDFAWWDLAKDVPNRPCKRQHRYHLRGPLDTAAKVQMSTAPSSQSGRWTDVAMDIIHGLPETTFRGREVNKILMIVDKFSGRALFYPISSTFSTEDFLDIFLYEYFPKFGLPRSIQSDHSPQFTSATFQEMMRAVHIDLKLTLAQDQQTDRLVQNRNMRIKQYLELVVPSNDEWPRFLSVGEHVLNSQPLNSLNNMSPFEMDIGHNPGAPAALLFPARTPPAMLCS